MFPDPGVRAAYGGGGGAARTRRGDEWTIGFVPVPAALPEAARGRTGPLGRARIGARGPPSPCGGGRGRASVGAGGVPRRARPDERR